MDVAVNSVLWVVSKALAPVTDGLLESWAASAGLGPIIDALKMELLYAQGMLDNVHGRDIRSPALKELLHKLRQLAYGADDALDELDYFRIQDVLDGTYHAANVAGLILNARHTAKGAANKLKLSSRSRDASPGDSDDQEDGGKRGCISSIRSCCRHEISSSPPSPPNRGVQEVAGGCTPKVTSCARSAVHVIGKHFLCYSFPLVHHDDAHNIMSETSDKTRSGQRFLCGAWPSKARQRNHVVQAAKKNFYRVEMSEKMIKIVEQLKPLCAKVSTILNLELLGSSRIPIQDTAMSRPETTPEIIEPKLYGRDNQKKNIVDGIIQGEYCTNGLTVLPVIGPGGIGKTTLIQHIYHEVESSFQVSIWICVSLDFNANRLAQEIVNKIPKVNGEKENASNKELIEQRLKSKRLLLVLDDMWTYHEDEWKKLIAPLRYSEGEKGNMVIVTTRSLEVASMVGTTNSSIKLERLDREDIMSFFKVCVFGDQQTWEDHPELCDVGKEIVTKLKGFPLAAKTVGRLLRNKLTLDHWTRVAESREWELQTGDNDIMPALKVSYDYLPFHLQQCFSYSALFPEDYEFGRKELVHLWIGLDILRSSGQKKRIEDVGLSYLDELVSHGFFKENKKKDGAYYVIHDLLHELAVNVSSYECLSVHSSNVRSIQVSPFVRHLSIIVDNTNVQDIMTFQDYKSDLSALGKRLEVQNIRTLMLFGEHHGSFAKNFSDLLREARALRTIFLSGATYSVEDMLPNFSELVHLRYLRIKSVRNRNMRLPDALFRSYHLEVIDLEKWGGRFCSTSQMSNLVKLRHFIVPEDSLELHSNILEVGKLKFLEELKRFKVGKETKGFEPSQLGELTELRGSLGICNLEKVQAKEKAKELKLTYKNHLHKLILQWDNKDPPQEENVLECLVPHKNLQDLCIRGHGGANCPSWLGGNLSVKNLKSLCLYDISWNKLPPLGDFHTLKRLELVKIPSLTKWVGNGTCDLFSLLEVVIIKDCPELTELPFSHPTGRQANQEENMSWLPKLQKLEIMDCPKLQSFPPIPWTPASCYIQIARAGSGFEELVYDRSALRLSIEGKDGQDSMFWNALAFHNLADLKVLEMEKCPPLPLDHLQKLKSLKTLKLTRMSNVWLLFEGESHIECRLPVERIRMWNCDVNGKELTQLLSHFPKLTELLIWNCKKITGVGVVEHQTAAGQTEHQQQQDELGAAATDKGRGLLLLPSQLQTLWFEDIGELCLLSNSLDNDNDNAGGGGLQTLCSLRSLDIARCPKFLSSYSSCASSCFPFPTSLQRLRLSTVEGMETLVPLSHLMYLTSLTVYNCGDLRGEGLWPLVTQGCLTEVTIRKTPKFFTGADPAHLDDAECRSCSSKLAHLETDDPAGVLTLPTCSLLLSFSLAKLTFHQNEDLECFTEEQEKALHLLTSLQELVFMWCHKLQRLPAGLTKLTNLKRLRICGCKSVRSLPKDGLPRCLQELDISSHFNSEELRRHCRKLKGTIPIVIDYY